MTGIHKVGGFNFHLSKGLYVEREEAPEMAVGTLSFDGRAMTKSSTAQIAHDPDRRRIFTHAVVRILTVSQSARA